MSLVPPDRGGTSTTISVALLEEMVALAPPIVTLLALVKLVPERVTVAHRDWSKMRDRQMYWRSNVSEASNLRCPRKYQLKRI